MDEKTIAKVKSNLKLSSLEIASSPWKLALGLMFRKSLPKGSGMLFDFHFSGSHGIWMLFMRFPIDIYFLDEKGKTASKVTNAEPLHFFRPSTWKIYRPKNPCRYAVEVSHSCK